MRFLYDGKLNELDYEIAKKIEKNPYIIINNNIYYSAKNLDVSASKLTKYCQKINMAGFKEFKYKLQQELLYIDGVGLPISNVSYSKLVNECVSPATLKNLLYIHDKIKTASRIIVVDAQPENMFSRHLCYSLRRKTNKDVMYYALNQNFSYEFLDQEVVVIIIDPQNIAAEFANAWYRSGHYYFHLCTKSIYSNRNYYPVIIDRVRLHLDLDAKIITILNWISNSNILEKSD